MLKISKKQISFFTILFLVWILSFLLFFGINEITEAVEAIKNANVMFIAISIFTFLLAILVSVSNIDFLMEKIGHKVRFTESFKITLVGYFIDSLLPNLISGGKITMAYLFQSREKVPLKKGFSVLIFYTIGWFLGFTLFVVLVMIYLLFFETFSNSLIFIIILLLMCFLSIFSFIIYIIAKPSSAKKIALFFIYLIFKLLKYTHFRVFEKKIINYTVKNIDSFAYFFKSQKKTGLAFFSSMVMFMHHLLMGISFYMVLVAFGVDISLFFALGIYILIYMISVLSMIPGQFGIYELVAIPLVSLNTGLVNSAIIIMVIRLIHYWSIIFIGGSCSIGMCIRK